MTSNNLQLFRDDEDESQILPDSPLSERIINGIASLYDQTDWRCVTSQRKLDREYDGLPVLGYFKALALPYLLQIPSERALGRLMIRRKSIQRLCGIRIKREKSDSEKKKVKAEDTSFGKRTLWHFRDKYKDIFAETMTKVLISLVLNGKRPNYNLPYVERIAPDVIDGTDGQIVVWEMNGYSAPAIIILPWAEEDLQTTEEKTRFENWSAGWKVKFRQCNEQGDLGAYRVLASQYEREYREITRGARRGFAKEVAFPIHVRTNLHSGEEVAFRLRNPDWLFGSIALQHSVDALSDLVPLRSYDKACTILVIRDSEMSKEILLSRRIGESASEERYAAPGGKQRASESLEACAIRELSEETGLALKKSRPVSIYYTLRSFGGKKQMTMSVGVLAEEWEGDPKVREPKKHKKWEWRSLEKLPEELFEFTEIAIEQYLGFKYPNLTWDDFEEKPDAQLALFE